MLKSCGSEKKTSRRGLRRYITVPMSVKPGELQTGGKVPHQTKEVISITKREREGAGVKSFIRLREAK